MGPLDMSGANPALFAALAKAQQAALTVGKDETNEQARYNYSSAEAMIRASRAAMAQSGLAVVSTWTTEKPIVKEGDVGNVFTCATVTEHWALTHADGGYIQGRAQAEALCSRRTPYQKAVAATATYMHGFVLRHVLNLDRAEEDEHAVDQAPQPQPHQSQTEEWRVSRELFSKVSKRRADLIQEHGIKGRESAADLFARSIGVKVAPPGRDITPEQWTAAARTFGDDIDDIELTLETAKSEAQERAEQVAEEFNGTVEGAAE